MSDRARTKQSVEPGLVPRPGELLNWRASLHYDRRDNFPCTLCKRLTPMRSHSGEPVHKACAEDWITTHPEEARRTGRFTSDAQPRTRTDHDHA
ncbi:hypothetical protein ABT160_24290 [Streptomyces sp. NPDC001941]|uniref:hypothetical protein n=1 Tax=Streptomyces sp. NPDC001941 TaxID=3154659 RepID=UPI00332A0B84